MNGKYKNLINGNVNNKIDFLSSYKFSIAMENREGDFIHQIKFMNFLFLELF